MKRLILVFFCVGATLPPLPPGASTLAVDPPKPRLQSPRDSTLLRSSVMVRSVVVPPVLTNWLVAFDPITNVGATYFITYQGGTQGVIQMGTNTSVLLTNVNAAVDWKLQAFSVVEGVTSRTASILVIPGLNRVALWPSNGVKVVSWYGATNHTYTLQSKDSLTGSWAGRTNRPGTNWYENFIDTGTSPARFYRYSRD
jgi:hypothetical protein